MPKTTVRKHTRKVNGKRTTVRKHVRKTEKSLPKYSKKDYGVKPSDSSTMSKDDKYYRVAALSLPTRPLETEVKVIFVRGGRSKSGLYASEDRKAFFMSRKVYNSFPLGQNVSLESFKSKGYVLEADNLDLYDDELEHKFYVVVKWKGDILIYPYDSYSDARYYLSLPKSSDEKAEVITLDIPLTKTQFKKYIEGR